MSDAIKTCINANGGLDTNIPNAESNSGGGLVTTTFADDYINRGNAFQIHRRITVPTAGKKIVLDFSTVTDKEIFTLPIRMKTNTGQVFVDTYIITAYIGGTVIPTINRNTTSINTAESIVKDGITSTDVAGDDVREYIVGELIARRNPGGGSGGGSSPKIFSPVKLVIDVDNQEEEEVIMELDFNWYEV